MSTFFYIPVGRSVENISPGSGMKEKKGGVESEVLDNGKDMWKPFFIPF